RSARLLRRRLGRTGRSTAGRTVLRYGIVGSALRRAGALWLLCPRWAWAARWARTARWAAAPARGSGPRRRGSGARRAGGRPTARGRVLPVVVRLLVPPLHHDLVRASVVRHRHRHRMPVVPLRADRSILRSDVLRRLRCQQWWCDTRRPHSAVRVDPTLPVAARGAG